MWFCFRLGVAGLAFVACACVSSQAAEGYQRSSAAGAKAVPIARVDPRSGQAIRTIVVAPKAAAARSSINVQHLVEEAAQKYDVNPALIDSVIQVESNYDATAVSPKGAQGLMQLMPDTARRFGVRDTFDPRDNIHGGVRYLKFLQDTFKDDRLAIAAYNAGERAVAKYNSIPPYPETMNYVAAVGKRYGKSKKAAEQKPKAAAAPAAAKPEAPEEPKYLPVRQYVDTEGRVHLTTY